MVNKFNDILNPHNFELMSSCLLPAQQRISLIRAYTF